MSTYACGLALCAHVCTGRMDVVAVMDVLAVRLYWLYGCSGRYGCWSGNSMPYARWGGVATGVWGLGSSSWGVWLLGEKA